MKDIAKKVFETEIESLQHVVDNIDDNFTRAVELILNASGRLIITGVGKSGIIGKKIAATLTSTGTPSFFLHPGEAFHGDLGIVGQNDPVLILSYSGETDEVLQLIPFLKWNKNVIIGMSGNPVSTLAKHSDHHLNIHILHEACPLKLAPTSSTTAALVMGDALAVALMEARKFLHEDFARFHPGGSLGRKLLVKVKDLMRTDKLPFIQPDASFTALLLKMSEGRLGMVMVGSADRIVGIVTDGDLRRALVKNNNIADLQVEDVMTTSPIIVDPEEYINAAEHLMIEKKITTLLVGSANDMSVVGVYQIYTL
ncbi:KpsF/GutQ family sugar-phosphate isomerase [Mucilaginibacter myungsuensis]|uniref:KpsF/GutQ family sugar-phosphate isomerase n=1 Tax=Mucilaginibacter myungsuensis TaxID=649104 RepID=A0A929KW14_9SPHI|nr:KpsF/GutQ family sugar-phosphate isomerase [Mucilaginibacter myungsuensis]MBE9662651.1 KpsF/GutQ family sugar-phosphate isomerase [Mucilaginibacter myungsuensis]MDN3598071.1 KpsF/GutQ family sugar-phosphate isomerase [Mucilaginibacter myungsuensis]